MTTSNTPGIMPLQRITTTGRVVDLLREQILSGALPEGALLRLGTMRFRHANGIQAAALSPDGKTLATAGHKMIRLWDVATGAARLTIEDRGPGVAEADRERIFEPFYRGQGAGSTLPGSGLGLAIVRQIARAHGGKVAYAPAEGGGSRFIVTLPLP